MPQADGMQNSERSLPPQAGLKHLSRQGVVAVGRGVDADRNWTLSPTRIAHSAGGWPDLGAEGLAPVLEAIVAGEDGRWVLIVRPSWPSGANSR
jgi:hypothetical protein